MKILLLGAATASMALTSAVASARPFDGAAGAHVSSVQYRRGGHWRTGQVFPDYRRSDRMLDWRRHHLPPPRPGYAYYYDDNGDVVMAALASGIIGLVLGNALSDGGSYYGAPYGYAPYGYPPPYAYPAPAPYPYAYAPPYDDDDDDGPD